MENRTISSKPPRSSYSCSTTNISCRTPRLKFLVPAGQHRNHQPEREGIEPDDLLCSRNARSRTPLVGRAQWKINQPPSLERERASLERPSIIVIARAAVLDGLFELPVGSVDPVSHSE